MCSKPGLFVGKTSHNISIFLRLRIGCPILHWFIMFPSVVSTVMTNRPCSYPYFAGDIWHVLITTFPRKTKPSITPIGCCDSLQLDLARLALGLETQWHGRGTTSNGWLTTQKRMSNNHSGLPWIPFEPTCKKFVNIVVVHFWSMIYN